jgi:hypothetical protein
MNKKIFIGSIFAVIILVVASLSPVIGFQTVKSNSNPVSPLFNIRTKRALGEESSDVVTCDYVGKGKASSISFPTRDNKIVLLQKLVHILSTLSDTMFGRFVSLFFNWLVAHDKIEENDKSEAIAAFQYMRDNPEEITGYIIGGEEAYVLAEPASEPTVYNWEFGCWIIFILKLLSSIIIFPFVMIELIVFFLFINTHPTVFCPYYL